MSSASGSALYGLANSSSLDGSWASFFLRRGCRLFMAMIPFGFVPRSFGSRAAFGQRGPEPWFYDSKSRARPCCVFPVGLKEPIRGRRRAFCRAAQFRGASEVSACCTHGVFSSGALEALERSSLKKVVATNTISNQDAEKSDFVEYVSVGEHLAKTIRQIFEYKSVSHLFPHY